MFGGIFKDKQAEIRLAQTVEELGRLRVAYNAEREHLETAVQLNDELLSKVKSLEGLLPQMQELQRKNVALETEVQDLRACVARSTEILAERAREIWLTPGPYVRDSRVKFIQGSWQYAAAVALVGVGKADEIVARECKGSPAYDRTPDRIEIELFEAARDAFAEGKAHGSGDRGISRYVCGNWAWMRAADVLGTDVAAGVVRRAFPGFEVI